MIKNRLNATEHDKCKGAIIRAKAKYFTDREKSSTYFLGIEKSKQSKIRHKIKTQKNKNNWNWKQRKPTTKNFSEDSLDEAIMHQTVERLHRTRKDEDRQWCDSPLILGEMEAAIDGLKPVRSPGSDDLSSGFYRTFKPTLAPVLLSIFNRMQATEHPEHICAWSAYTHFQK